MTLADATIHGAAPQDPVPDHVLDIRDLHVDYRVRGGLGRRADTLHAVDGVNLSIPRGSTLGLVGESGCGKSTLVKTILGLKEARSGQILLDGEDLLSLRPHQWRSRRPKFQVVFQDPYTSLDPRMNVHDAIADPLRIHSVYSKARVNELLEYVGLSPDHAKRGTGTYSGGQRQRICIARALALEPQLLILDEPVSSLDKSIQAQVLNLLKRLQKELGLSYLFISHDLSVIRHMSHDVAVMYLGRIVESGTRREVFDQPAHPYTRALMTSVPFPRPEGREARWDVPIKGEVPDPLSPPSGCSFHPRCVHAVDDCSTSVPAATEWTNGNHQAACLRIPETRSQLG